MTWAAGDGFLLAGGALAREGVGVRIYRREPIVETTGALAVPRRRRGRVRSVLGVGIDRLVGTAMC